MSTLRIPCSWPVARRNSCSGSRSRRADRMSGNWPELFRAKSSCCLICCNASRRSGAQTMNVHHLELFYYVAKHGGISEAVRNMPYGIQQPAVSGQISQLESFLGLTLFRRRPFSLTPGGQELFDFIQ